MSAKIAYVILEGITTKEGDWFDKDTGEPQVKYNLRCTGKSGATVWFNLFAKAGQDNTILKGFLGGMGVKITFLQSGDKGQFKNVKGISRAEVKVEKKSGGADQDKIMMQACLKAAGTAVPSEIILAPTVSQWIWDVAEDLFLKLNSRRFGGETAKPATAEMSKEESKKYEEPPQDPPGKPDPGQRDLTESPPSVADDEEIPF